MQWQGDEFQGCSETEPKFPNIYQIRRYNQLNENIGKNNWSVTILDFGSLE